jgi:uncharacterized protein YkwD
MKYYIFTLSFAFILLIQSVYSQTPGSNKFKKEFLKSINNTRKKGCNCGTTYMPPAGPLVWNDLLERAAMAHARDMAIKTYFSHVSKDGRTTLTRVENAGYTHDGYKSFTVGENIAQGQPTIDEVMTGWFNSPGHCMNLMNPDFKEVGIWVFATYWVQDFGGREDFSSEMKRMIKSGKARIIQGSSRERY